MLGSKSTPSVTIADKKVTFAPIVLNILLRLNLVKSNDHHELRDETFQGMLASLTTKGKTVKLTPFSQHSRPFMDTTVVTAKMRTMALTMITLMTARKKKTTTITRRTTRPLFSP